MLLFITELKFFESDKTSAGLLFELSESVNLVEVTPEAPKRVSTGMGSSGMRANWKYEIVDFALLSDAYKVEASSLLNAHAKAYHDQKPIAGVRFFNEPILAVNTR